MKWLVVFGVLLVAPVAANTFKENASEMTRPTGAVLDALAPTGRMLCGPNSAHVSREANGSANLTAKDNIITLSRHQVFRNAASNELLCKRYYYVPDFENHPSRRIEIKVTAACAARLCGKATVTTDVFEKYAQDWCVLKLPQHVTTIQPATTDPAMCVAPQRTHMVAGYAIAKGRSRFSVDANGKKKITGGTCDEFPMPEVSSGMPQLLRHNCSTLAGSSGGGFYEMCTDNGSVSVTLRGIHVGGFTRGDASNKAAFTLEDNANVAVSFTGALRQTLDHLAASGDTDPCAED